VIDSFLCSQTYTTQKATTQTKTKLHYRKKKKLHTTDSGAFCTDQEKKKKKTKKGKSIKDTNNTKRKHATTDNPENNLAKFGYILDMKIE